MTVYAPPTNISATREFTSLSGDKVRFNFSPNPSAPIGQSLLNFYQNGVILYHTMVSSNEASGVCYVPAGEFPVGWVSVTLAYQNAYNEVGPYSAVVTFFNKPNVPANLAYNSLGYTYFSVSWSPVADATEYTLYNNGITTSVADTSYVYTNLAPNSTYSITVTSTVAGVESFQGNSITVQTPSIPAPASTSIPSLWPSGFRFQWEPVSGISEYQTQRIASGVTQTDIVNTSFIDYSGLPSNTYNALAVRAKSDSYYSSWITTSTTTLPALPSIPLNLFANSITNTSYVLQWTAPSQGPVVGYNIYRGWSGNYQTSVGSGVTSHQIVGMSAGQTETWGIRAYSGDGEGPTAYVTVTTIPAAPILSVQSSTNSATISWPTVVGATSYELYLDGDVTSINVVGTEYTFSDLTGLSHSVVAYAKNSNGQSVASVLGFELLIAPPIISLVSGENSIFTNQIDVQWSAVPEVLSYDVFLNGNFVVNQLAVEPRIHSFQSLQPNMVYTVEVVAKTSTQSSARAQLIQHTRPQAPTILSVIPQTSTSFGVVWLPLEVTGYYCYINGIKNDYATTNWIVITGRTAGEIIPAVSITAMKYNQSSAIVSLESSLSNSASVTLPTLNPDTINITTGNAEYQIPRHSAGGLRDSYGELFVAGGKNTDTDLRSCIFADPDHVFYSYADMPQARFGHVMFGTPGSEDGIMVHGGVDSSQTFFNTIIKYDINTSVWNSICNFTNGVKYHAATPKISNEETPGYYIYGGLVGINETYSSEMYKFLPTTNTLSLVSQSGGPQVAYHSIAMFDGYFENLAWHGRGLYVYGGYTTGNQPNTAFWFYDLTTQAWSQLASPPPEISCDAKLVCNDSIKCIFAYNGGEYIGEYNIVTDRWILRNLTPLITLPPTRREHLFLLGKTSSGPSGCLLYGGRNAEQVYYDFWKILTVFPPDSITYSDLSHYGMTITWEQEYTAKDGYRIYIDSNPELSIIGLSTMVTGRVPGSTVKIQISSVDSGFESQQLSRQILVDLPPLLAPAIQPVYEDAIVDVALWEPNPSLSFTGESWGTRIAISSGSTELTACYNFAGTVDLSKAHFLVFDMRRQTFGNNLMIQLQDLDGIRTSPSTITSSISNLWETKYINLSSLDKSVLSRASSVVFTFGANLSDIFDVKNVKILSPQYETPSNLAVGITANTIIANWTPSQSTLASYVVHWGIGGFGAYSEQAEIDVANLNYTITGIPLQNYYYVGISGKDSFGNQTLISEAQQKIWLGAPLVPNNLRVVNADYHEMAMAWDASDGSVAYKVRFNSTIIDVAGQTSTIITGLIPQTEYDFQICGVNSLGETSAYTELGECVATTQPFPSIEGLSSNNIDHNSFVISWEPQNHATSYSIFINSDLYKSVSATDSSCLVEGRLPSTSYPITITWTDGIYVSEPSSSLVITTTAMSLITGLEVAPTTFATCQLFWNAVPKAIEYYIYVNGVNSKTTTQPVGEISDLAAGTAYTFAIQWSDGVSLSALSQFVAVNMPEMLLAPSTISTSTNTFVSFNVAWNSSANAAFYRLILDGEPYATEFASSPALAIPFLHEGRSIEVAIVTCNAYGCSLPSETVTVIPAAPTDLPATLGTITPHIATFDVEGWTAVSGAAFYRLNLNGVDDTTEHVSTSAIGVPFPTFSQPTSLKIKACNDGGCTAASDISAMVAPLAPVDAPTINAPAINTVPVKLPAELGWSPVAGTDKYEIQIALNTDFEPLIETKLLEANLYTTTYALERGQQFYWKVRATNISGTGPWSSVGSFISQLDVPAIVSPLNSATNVQLTAQLNWEPRKFAKRVGDVAIIHINSTTSPDVWSFVALTDIPAEQSLKWTDNGWKVSGGFRAGETIASIPHPALARGEVYTVSCTGLSALGEQLFVFCGDELATTEQGVKFLYGINWGDDGGWATDATNSSTSYLPSTLFESGNLSLGTGGSWYYAGPMNGTKDYILGCISNPEYWQLDVGQSLTTWTRGNFAIADANGIMYDWQIATDNNMAEIIADAVSQANAFYAVVPHLLATSTSYYWRVRAKNARATTAWTTINTFVTTAASSVPDLISPNNGSVGVELPITFSWASSFGGTEITYHLQVSLNSGYSAIVVDQNSINANSIVVNDLTGGNIYYWRLRSFNTIEYSDWSISRTFTVAGAPSLPILLSPSNEIALFSEPINTNLVWQNSEGAGTIVYDVQVATEASFTDIIFSATGIDATTVAPSSLSYASVFYWRVRGTSEYGVGSWSSPFAFSTIIAPPDAVILLSPANVDTNVCPQNPLFQWETTSTAERYVLQIASNSEFTSDLLELDVLEGTKSVSTLTPVSQYWWRVLSINSSGTTPSTIRSFTTGTVVPTNIGAENDATASLGGQALVTWEIENVSGITGFKVYYGTIAGGPYASSKTVLVSTARSLTIDGLNNGQIYYFVVVSLRNTVESVFSDEVYIVPSDVAGPGAVASLSITPSDEGGKIELSWTNPEDLDFAGVVILRRTDTYPTSYNDPNAFLVCSGAIANVVDDNE